MSHSPEGRGAESDTLVVDMLDTLFLRAVAQDPRADDPDIAPGIAILCSSSQEYELECLRLLNWPAKDMVEIARPTLDSPETGGVLSQPHGLPGTLYRLNVADLFGRSHQLLTAQDNEPINLPSINYDVFTGKIALWGTTTEGTTLIDEADIGTPSYSCFASSIIEATNLAELVKGFEFAPEDFTD